ncbi:MAG: HAMP domain-containing protein [Firmicutes bacterium]|nr:HAMP domain-containing protein [Bacillota bacterium]
MNLSILNKQKSDGKKSIRARITLIFILVIMIMTIAFFFFMMRKDMISNVYQKDMDTNLKLNQLSLELNNNSRVFNLYFQTRDQEDLNNYIESRNMIRELVVELKDNVAVDKDSRIFYRTLSNMLLYHDELVSQIFNNKISNAETYQILTDLRTLYLYMNSHAQKLIISYQDYSSSKYMDLLEEYQAMERRIYTLTILTSIICLFFALVLSNDILKTIDRLSASAHSLSAGHWEVRDIKENKYRELNIMGQAFNLMKHNINKFIKELKQKSELENKLNKEKLASVEKDRLIKETQLMNLQMQIDPHFLFNTLTTVARIALFEKARKTERLIVAISRILRYNLDNKGKMVEITQDLEVLQAYLSIQQIRFQSQMKFNIQIEGNIAGILVPPMILQPIVENAIIHGLADIDENGRIDIKIIKKEKYLEIKIIDNGKGIDSEYLKNIFQKKGGNRGRSTTGLGLANVKKRLELHYGEELISINSVLGQGTEVIIQIPLRKGGYR